MIIFDVIVDDKKIDELHPKTVTMKELIKYIEEQMNKLQKQHGSHVYLNRRYTYRD